MHRPLLKSTILAATLLCIAVGSNVARAGTESAGDASFNWQPDLGSAVEAAKSSNKNLLVDVSASWCPHCRHLESSILPKPKVVALLNKDFVAVKVDADSKLGKKIQSQYSIQGVPDLLVFDSTGAIRGKLAGAPANANFFVQMVSKLEEGAPDKGLPSIADLVRQ